MLTTFIVQTVDDVVADDGLTSLREAVISANADQTDPVDLIAFAASLRDQTISLESELTITDAVVIQSGSAIDVTLDGGRRNRIFTIGGDAGEVRFSGLKLTRGFADRGGALLVSAGSTVVLDSIAVSDSRAFGTQANDGGGAIYQEAGSSLTISNSTISGSVSTQSGGGIFVGGSLALTDTELLNNLATQDDADGGALYVAATADVSMTGGRIDGNQSNRDGGGIYNRGFISTDGTRFDSNQAGGNGGAVHQSADSFGVFASGVVADGQANGEGGGFWNAAGATTTIIEMQVNDNVANIGGGIFAQSNQGDKASDLSVDLAGMAGNSASTDGGAIAIQGGAFSLVRSTVDQNEADRDGGGLHLSGGSNVTIERSTLSNNVAERSGGGIFITPSTDEPAAEPVVLIFNATISGNEAETGGGGIAMEAGLLTPMSVTIAKNVAGRGGGLLINGGTVETVNTLIGVNSAASNPDIEGMLVSGGHNLFSQLTDEAIIDFDATDLVNVEPSLLQLGDYGGRTRTHALSTVSPAIGAGNRAGLTDDQRESARPSDQGADIGAYESTATTPATTDPGNINADLGIVGWADDGIDDEFSVVFDVGQNELSVSLGGAVLYRASPNASSSIRIRGSSDRDTLHVSDATGSGQNVEFLGGDGDDGFTLSTTGNAKVTLSHSGSTKLSEIDIRKLPEPSSTRPQSLVDVSSVEDVQFHLGKPDSQIDLTLTDATTSSSALTISGDADEVTTASAGTFATVESTQYQATVSGFSTIDSSLGDVRPLLQNATSKLDANRDGKVTAVDALVVINLLGRVPDGDLASIIDDLDEPIATWLDRQLSVDVSGDNVITARDALLVINALARTTANSEPESTVSDTPTPLFAPPEIVASDWRTGLRFGFPLRSNWFFDQGDFGIPSR